MIGTRFFEALCQREGEPECPQTPNLPKALRLFPQQAQGLQCVLVSTYTSSKVLYLRKGNFQIALYWMRYQPSEDRVAKV